MKVILKQDVKGVGRKFDVKDVSDGYAANFLIPRKLAEYASAEAVKKAETLKSQNQADILIQEKLAEKQMEMLKEVKVVLEKKANDKGSLFEKIHEIEISKALSDQFRITLDPEFLRIEKPIKEIGEHKVLVQFGKSKGEFFLSVESKD